jgi:hypothetical protein
MLQYHSDFDIRKETHDISNTQFCNIFSGSLSIFDNKTDGKHQ